MSTMDVLTWLDKYNCKFVRTGLGVKKSHVLLKYGKKADVSLVDWNFEEIKFDSIKSVWYRRGSTGFESDTPLIGFESKVIQFESYLLDQFIRNTLKSKPFINSYDDNYLNKLEVLHFCSQNEIRIPETLIANDSSEVIFSKLHERIITKHIGDMGKSAEYKGYRISAYATTQVLKSNIGLKGNFLPSLFQEYIEKKYEIRSFYLNGKFKSMAIFSQQNEKTKSDFRNYDYERPNRCVPYLLPKSYEKKLHKLMLHLGINCGSFDIIVTPNDEYYFLEVNPIGQFHWLSKNCNYFIERMIARTLAGKS